MLSAESREESLLLAKQLAAARADAQKARAASSKLGRQLETEQLLRTDAEGAAEALKQRLERLLDGSKEASKQRTDLAEVRGGAGVVRNDGARRVGGEGGTSIGQTWRRDVAGPVLWERLWQDVVRCRCRGSVLR